MRDSFSYSDPALLLERQKGRRGGQRLGVNRWFIARTRAIDDDPELDAHFCLSMLSSRRSQMVFVLVPGAGGMAWYWHRVVPLIRAAGHDAIAVDLPGEDRRAGLAAYADLVIDAIAERSDVVLVAQSLAGFTAPLACQRAPVRMLVFVNAMIPKPGETAGAWWGATGAVEARNQAAARGGYATEFDVATYFLHDVPPAVLRAGPKPREEAEIIFGEPCLFESWPDIPIHVLAGRDDRFFPIEFQRRVAGQRLGKEVEEIPGGHLVALSNPEGLAERLVACEKRAS